MINQIKYSGLFPERHASPVGTTQGINQPKPVAPVVPVQMREVPDNQIDDERDVAALLRS